MKVEIKLEPYTLESLEDSLDEKEILKNQKKQGLLALFILSCVAAFGVYEAAVLWGEKHSIVTRLILPDGGILQRSIPFLIVFCEAWCLLFLLSRLAWLRKQNKANRDPALINALEKSKALGTKEILPYLEKVKSRSRGILFDRLKVIFLVKSNLTPLIFSYDSLKDRWSLENDTLSSDYDISRVLIWAMPILGFIGTVFGISISVGEFSLFLNQSGETMDIGLIKERLSDVAAGLAFAFDTTLLGLVGSLVAMVTTSIVQNREERFLARVDAISLRLLGLSA